MAFSKEVLDEILKNYHGPDDFYGPEGIMKQLTKALVERTMEAELTCHLGYEKHDQGEKTIANRRNGKTTKDLRTDEGPMRIEVPRDRVGSVSGNNDINLPFPDAVDNITPYAHPLGRLYSGRKNRDIYVAAFFRVIKAGPEQPYPGVRIRLADRVNQSVLFSARYSHIL